MLARSGALIHQQSCEVTTGTHELASPSSARTSQACRDRPGGSVSHARNRLHACLGDDTSERVAGAVGARAPSLQRRRRHDRVERLLRERTVGVPGQLELRQAVDAVVELELEPLGRARVICIRGAPFDDRLDV